MGLRGTGRLLAVMIATVLALVTALCAYLVSAEPAAAAAASAKKGKCAKKRGKKPRSCKKRKRAPAQPAPQPAPGSPGGSGGGGGPTYSGDFVTEISPFQFSQAPGWSPDGKRIVFHQVKDDDADPDNDTQQIWTAKLDGSDQVCVTCGKPGLDGRLGPNLVAQYHPSGEKILFHSWRDKRFFTIGSPGFGGVGAEVYVVNADGTGPITRLTGVGEDSEHNFATGEPDETGEGEDNYHAYFSPDGTKLVWTHLDCNFVTQDGECQMEINYADYVDLPGDDADPATAPRITNIKQALPENGHYYETQLWAPDNSGFLYTESVDNSLNLELFFYDVRDGSITRLTDHPAWDEQATFTPDMKKVIFMSTRDHPGFFNTYRDFADLVGLGAETDWLTILPVFEVSFLQPVAQESTDLYELDLATDAVRRLTTSGDDGWIVPEFAFDPAGSGRLLWTEARFPDGTRMQFPPDAVRDTQEFVDYLSSGNLPIDPREGGGNVGLDTIAGIERRTVFGRYVGN